MGAHDFPHIGGIAVCTKRKEQHTERRPKPGFQGKKVNE